MFDRTPSLALTTALSLLCLTGFSVPAAAQLRTELLATGLDRPTWVGAPQGDARLFVAEKAGRIRLLDDGSHPTVLDLSGRVTLGGEQGLLGMAFHPAFASNGHFFVCYTDLGGNTVVSRYTMSASDPNVADPASETLVLAENQPGPNHNAGCLVFGPDGYLYISLGDGAGGFDPLCNGQNTGTILGAILRIDVDVLPYAIPPDNPFVGVSGARPEVWHYGVRNPWRFSFDRLTGDLFFGDVGELEREEISFAPAGSSGINFGWKTMEGNRCVGGAATSCSVPACGDPLYTPPVFEMIHTGDFSGPRAVVGGFVYRGTALPGEYGRYFFADFADDRIRSFRYDGTTGVLSNFLDRTSEFAPGGGLELRDPVTFGEDGFGELLIVDHGFVPPGEVYKVVPAGAVEATSVTNNGTGVNPSCYSTRTAPLVGGLWEAVIDTTSIVNPRTVFILGYDAGAAGPVLLQGEVLVGGNQIFRFQEFSAGADEVVFQRAIPPDPSLNGASAITQAFVLGSPSRLCNRIDLTIGYY